MNQQTVSIALAVLGVILLWVLLSTSRADTFINPITREEERVALTRADQIEMGTEMRLEIEQELNGLESNSEINARISSISSRLLQALRQLEIRFPHPENDATHLSNFPYQFRVVQDEAVINALALPGGSIYITMGLYRELESDDELAAVLAHEIGHVALRHSAQAFETLIKGQLALYLLSKLIGQTHTLFDAGELTEFLLQLRFSRDRESASDRFGYMLLCLSGYDPRGLSQVFEFFKQISTTSNPEWSLTHPLPESRIESVKRMSCAF